MTLRHSHFLLRPPRVRKKVTILPLRPNITLPRRWQSTDVRKDSNVLNQRGQSSKISGVWSQFRGSLALPVRLYCHWQGRRPYVTQVISSILIYTIGDLTAQYIESRGITKNITDDNASQNSSSQQTFLKQLDPARLVRTVITGAIISIPGYRWMMFLSNHFNLKSKSASVAYKILINQFIYAPFIGTYFFSMQSLLSGNGVFSTWDRVKHTVPTTWTDSWKFWPFVMAANFSFIRPENRSIFAIGAGIIWQTYLCMVNKQEVERLRQQQRAKSVLANA